MKTNLTAEWLYTKCHQCKERVFCLSKKGRREFNRRVKEINSLDHCPDYDFDHSVIPIDTRQVCHEEVTFDELMNKGHMPLDLEDGIWK